MNGSKMHDTIRCVERRKSNGETPIRRERSYSFNSNEILYCSIFREAWEDMELDPDTTGSVEQYYFPEQGMIVLDFPSPDGGVEGE